MSNIQIKKDNVEINIKENQIISMDDALKRVWLTLDNNKRVYIKAELFEEDASYHAFSKYFIEAEYIASRILKAINIPVQDVELIKITYEDGIERLACMCYDITNDTNYKLESFNEVSGYLEGIDINNSLTTFKLIERIVDTIENLDVEASLARIYTMFVADMLIGNYDRSCGNIAILKDDTYTAICPLFDNTSTMGLGAFRYQESLSDEEIYRQIQSTNSAIYYNNGKSINYVDFFNNVENITEIETQRMFNAIKEIFANIDMNKIKDAVFSTDLIDSDRKQYYIDYFRVSYEQVLIPTLERIKEKRN